MTWNSYYTGTGEPRPHVWLPPAPPWRTFPHRPAGDVFQPPEGLTDAVNAALCLRRPLLLTGPPGSGKSTVIEQVALELGLGAVLRWQITSRSTLADALYRYDALGRIHAHQLSRDRGDTFGAADDIAAFLQLGPLGSALLPARRPRALLIDEIDKADLDLPGDLLDVLERGEFTVVELLRENRTVADVRTWEAEVVHRIENGRVRCTEFPFIVMTSNGDQEMPPAFLRRCVRYTMPPPTVALMCDVVRKHLRLEVRPSSPEAELVQEFVERVGAGETVAVDQLLSTLHILSGTPSADSAERERVKRLLMKDLSRA
ncbi:MULTISPECIES: AAA family ATPase [unclassified Streptomyces]|uniref:AAA family ATPase n=1 Tax=unclassified Streptomyces TaxID=2593676 RepID=UPI0004BED8A8|nr:MULTISPECIES: AAA family ATPase [unclassified Streptomyces]